MEWGQSMDGEGVEGVRNGKATYLVGKEERS